MTTDTLIRWSGRAGLLGGILLALNFLFLPGGADPAPATVQLHTPYAAEHSLAVFGLVLILFGLTGIYTVQAQAVGRLGLLGYVLSFVACALLVGVSYSDAYVYPTVAAAAPHLFDLAGALVNGPIVLAYALPSVGLLLGALLLGVATLRAQKLSRAATLCFLLGAVLLNLPPQPQGPVPLLVIDLGAVVWAVGLGWLGLTLERASKQAAVPAVALAEEQAHP